MKLKDGVFTEVTVIVKGKPVKLVPSVEIKAAMEVADALSKEIVKQEITITSILDGKHKEGSKHYKGDAFDMRTWSSIFTGNKLPIFISNLIENLGKNYDVVLHNTHLHVEFDPK